MTTPTISPMSPETMTAMRRFADQWAAGVRQLQRDVAPAMRAAAAAMRRLAVAVQRVPDDEVHVAGLCARYHVRAGLHPAASTPGGLDRLVQGVLTGEDGSLAFATPTTRARVAASAIRGWVESYDTPADGMLPWHRYLDGTRVVVTRG